MRPTPAVDEEDRFRRFTSAYIAATVETAPRSMPLSYPREFFDPFEYFVMDIWRFFFHRPELMALSLPRQ